MVNLQTLPRRLKLYVVEHFGFVDGMSNTLFLEEDLKEVEAEAGRCITWDPSAPLSLVLVQDKNAQEEDSYGSFFVFRKLEQNVRAFRETEIKFADALGLEGKARKRAGALIMGRFRNGVPLVLQDTEDPDRHGKFNRNNFDFREDKEGIKCPINSHIRKVNPREARNEQERKVGQDNRIVRRSITYGKRDLPLRDNLAPEELPTGGVGILFMCFQRDISTQFSFIQKMWANNPDFPLSQTPRPGIDPIAGQGSREDQWWSPVWGRSGFKKYKLPHFVILRGGEYFFAPSISFLKTIAGGPGNV